MTINIVNMVRDRVISEMESGELSQSQVAAESGVGKTRINQWLKGDYPGNNQEIEDQLNVWLSSRKKRADNIGKLPDPPDWVRTETGMQIDATLSYTQLAGDMSCIYGGAGVGKTLTCRRYKEQNPNVWIATMTPAAKAEAASLERIAIALGLKNYPGRAARLEMAIADRLQDTKGLLIIDEVQHLKNQALESIRSLYDQTGIGLALVGNEIVYGKLIGDRSHSAWYAQLHSRIGKRVHLNKPHKTDVESIAEAWGITEKAIIQELVRIAEKPGALRGMTKTLRLASMIAMGKGVPMGLSEIQAASRDLGIR